MASLPRQLWEEKCIFQHQNSEQTNLLKVCKINNFSWQEVINRQPLLHWPIWQPSLGGSSWTPTSTLQGKLATKEEKPLQPRKPGVKRSWRWTDWVGRKRSCHNSTSHGRWDHCHHFFTLNQWNVIKILANVWTRLRF